MSDLRSSAYLEGEIKSQVSKFPLSVEQVCRIGRNETSTIVLEDDLASRNHAILQSPDMATFYLMDLNSTNGTFLNGLRVTTPVMLRPGDRIQIGNHEFLFHQQVVQVPDLETVEGKATSLLRVMKMITVLVVDIRDFTGLGQQLSSDKLAEVTGYLFRAAGELLQERGAWAQKYIGDAVMAVWVHRTQVPAIEEYLTIFEALWSLHAMIGGLQVQFELDRPIRTGAGLNTGSALIGNFGSIAASDFSALGEVVNKAFRLESATKAVGADLVVGDKIYELLSKTEGVAALLRCCEVKLKGYEQPTTAYAGELASLPALVTALQKSLQAITTK
jgi:adenylate cyclase